MGVEILAELITPRFQETWVDPQGDGDPGPRLCGTENCRCRDIAEKKEDGAGKYSGRDDPIAFFHVPDCGTPGRSLTPRRHSSIFKKIHADKKANHG
jgi:hypothetical protein